MKRRLLLRQQGGEGSLRPRNDHAELPHRTLDDLDLRNRRGGRLGTRLGEKQVAALGLRELRADSRGREC